QHGLGHEAGVTRADDRERGDVGHAERNVRPQTAPADEEGGARRQHEVEALRAGRDPRGQGEPGGKGGEQDERDAHERDRLGFTARPREAASGKPDQASISVTTEPSASSGTGRSVRSWTVAWASMPSR